MITVLNINLIAGRTGAAKLCKTITEGLDKNIFSYHTLVGYDFGNDDNTTSVYKTSNSWLYTTLRYKGAVGFNFLFDRMTPGCIDMQFLNTFPPYQLADIIHFHSIQGGYIDRSILPEISQHKKIVFTLHDDWLISGNDHNHNLFPYKSKKSYNKRKHIFSTIPVHYVGVSNRMSNKVKYDPILGKNTVKTIYNGIDTTIFKKYDKEVIKNELGLPVGKKIVISIAGSGNKSNLKGLSYVKKIMQHYMHKDEYLFITLGNTTTKKVNNSFREVGFVESSLMAKYFNAADCFLYPTLADSFGLVVAESIACGCPVVTFEIGGVPEIMCHKINGYIAKYKDYNDLLVGFERLMANKNTLTVSLEETFFQSTMVGAYTALYKSLID